MSYRVVNRLDETLISLAVGSNVNEIYTWDDKNPFPVVL